MGQIKKLRQLFCHKGYLTCSVFMEKSNQFFTASFDKQVCLWQFDSKLGWQVTQKLQGHKRVVTCLRLYNGDDQLMGGSLDETIRIWNRTENWQCKQKIVLKYIQISSLSLNQTETLLIVSCLPRIVILELKQNQQIWSVMQEIKTCDGKKFCFLDDKTFILQPDKGNLITIYKQDEQDLQFKQHKLLQLSESLKSFWRFPIKYIEKQNLLLIQINSVINLIKHIEQEEFKILQQIQFQKEKFIGTISEDARYLITWQGDEKSQNIFRSTEVQFRMLRQLN